MESSCSHPREAMNLVLKCRISRRNRTASLFQRAVSKHDVSPGRSPWYSCPVRLMFRCFKHHAEGRVTTPEGCPENPQRERLEQVGRHLRRTCRLALRTKDPGGPGSNCGSAARDGRSRSRPCRREGSGWVQDPCRLGPWAPAPGWHVTQRCGRRRDSVLPPPLSSRYPRSPARSLGSLISRIFHHLKHSWPPRRAQGMTSRRVYCFSANRRALRPAGTEAASPPPRGTLVREGAARDEKTKGPCLGGG